MSSKLSPEAAWDTPTEALMTAEDLHTESFDTIPSSLKAIPHVARIFDSTDPIRRMYALSTSGKLEVTPVELCLLKEIMGLRDLVAAFLDYEDVWDDPNAELYFRSLSYQRLNETMILALQKHLGMQGEIPPTISTEMMSCSVQATGVPFTGQSNAIVQTERIQGVDVGAQVVPVETHARASLSPGEDSQLGMRVPPVLPRSRPPSAHRPHLSIRSTRNAPHLVRQLPEISHVPNIPDHRVNPDALSETSHESFSGDPIVRELRRPMSATSRRGHDGPLHSYDGVLNTLLATVMQRDRVIEKLHNQVLLLQTGGNTEIDLTGSLPSELNVIDGARDSHGNSASSYSNDGFHIRPVMQIISSRPQSAPGSRSLDGEEKATDIPANAELVPREVMSNIQKTLSEKDRELAEKDALIQALRREADQKRHSTQPALPPTRPQTSPQRPTSALSTASIHSALDLETKVLTVQNTVQAVGHDDKTATGVEDNAIASRLAEQKTLLATAEASLARLKRCVSARSGK